MLQQLKEVLACLGVCLARVKGWGGVGGGVGGAWVSMFTSAHQLCCWHRGAPGWPALASVAACAVLKQSVAH